MLGRTGIDSQLQVSRVPRGDFDLGEVYRLVFYLVSLAVSSFSGNVNLAGKHTMLDDNIAVGTENDVLLDFTLSATALLFLLTRIPGRVASGSVELLVNSFQIRILIVQRLEVQGSLSVELALILHGIADLDVAVDFRTPIPVVRSVVSSGTVHPIQDRDMLKGKIPSDIELLVIFQRSTEVSNALLDGILPNLVLVWIQFLINLDMRLLNTCVRPGSELHTEVVREVPAQAESPIPIELLAERNGNLILTSVRT